MYTPLSIWLKINIFNSRNLQIFYVDTIKWQQNPNWCGITRVQFPHS